MNDPAGRRQYEPQRRGGLIVVVAAVVVLLVGFVVLIVVLGGGSGSLEEADNNPVAGEQAPATNGQDQTEAGNPALSSGGEEEESSEQGAEGEGRNGEGEPSNGASGGESGQGDAPSEQDEAGASDEGADSDSGSGGDEEPQPVDVDNEGRDQSEGSAAESSDNGSGEQPGSYDPLGTDAKPGDLTETDRERARLVVAEFVSAAYGYAGEDATTYSRAIDQQVVRPDFYSSPAGEELSANVESFEQSHDKSEATLDRFEISGTEPGEVVGTAYYEAGPVEGSQSKYLQEITLVPDGAVFKVRSASVPQEVS